MKKVLSFDISSSTIGWTLMEYDQSSFNLMDFGYIKPPKKEKGSISFRLNSTNNSIEDLIKKHCPDEVAVEDYAKRFSGGRTTANTIIILSTFNEIVCLAAFRVMGMDAYRYPVVRIRSQVGKLFGIKIVSKDDIFPEIVKRSTFFVPQKNKNNNTKIEYMDVADAIAVGITHILNRSPDAKRYSL